MLLDSPALLTLVSVTSAAGRWAIDSKTCNAVPRSPTPSVACHRKGLRWAFNDRQHRRALPAICDTLSCLVEPEKALRRPGLHFLIEQNRASVSASWKPSARSTPREASARRRKHHHRSAAFFELRDRFSRVKVDFTSNRHASDEHHSVRRSEHVLYRPQLSFVQHFFLESQLTHFGKQVCSLLCLAPRTQSFAFLQQVPRES